MKLRYHQLRPEEHEGWIEQRKFGVGASEASALFNANKYSSAYRLWRLKLGLDEPIEENFAMEMGHVLEQHVADCFEKDMGIQVIKATGGDWLAIDNEKPFLRVSPDRLCWAPGEKKNMQNRIVLECKTSRINHSPECLSNECLSWYIQVQYQLYVLGLKHAYLGFLCTETGNRWYEPIEYNQELCENTIIPTIELFWNTCIIPARKVLEGVKEITPEVIEELHIFAPKVTFAEDVALRFPQQVEGKSINLSDLENPDELQEYIQRRAVIKELTDQQKEFEGSVKLKMMDAESVLGSDGKPVITFKANKNGSRIFKVK